VVLDKKYDKIFAEGKQMPIVEDFYTIQGEGYHTGKPAYFIRVGGCDIGCKWCDSKISWNPDKHRLVDIEEIVENALNTAAKAVVVTGGEPSLYNMTHLCQLLKDNKIETFLETSGAHEISGVWDWVCLSPKHPKLPVDSSYAKANELKVIIENPEIDFDFAEEMSQKVGDKCLLYMQSEWSKYRQNIPYMVEYVKKNPKWNISLQTHKFMNIP
jgi:organic radical activating enzyme